MWKDEYIPRSWRDLYQVVERGKRGDCWGLESRSVSPLTTGHVLEDWEITCVVLLFKKKNKDTPEYYDPVSPMSVVGKLLQRILQDTNCLHLEENGLIKDNQHCFGQDRSWLIKLIDLFWRGYDKEVVVVCMEFQANRPIMVHWPNLIYNWFFPPSWLYSFFEYGYHWQREHFWPFLIAPQLNPIMGQQHWWDYGFRLIWVTPGKNGRFPYINIIN